MVDIEVVLYDELLSVREAANGDSIAGPHGSVRKLLANFRTVYKIDHRSSRVGTILGPSSGMRQHNNILVSSLLEIGAMYGFNLDCWGIILGNDWSSFLQGRPE